MIIHKYIPDSPEGESPEDSGRNTGVSVNQSKEKTEGAKLGVNVRGGVFCLIHNFAFIR